MVVAFLEIKLRMGLMERTIRKPKITLRIH